MKNLLALLLLSVLSLSTVKAQNVKCQELLEFVVENGYFKGEISSIALFDSDWLKAVKAYEYKGSVFVVAEIKKDDFSYQTNTYIFCGIPVRNWDNFESIFINSDLTYGEKFHKYIIDYKCNCK